MLTSPGQVQIEIHFPDTGQDKHSLSFSGVSPGWEMTQTIGCTELLQ